MRALPAWASRLAAVTLLLAVAALAYAGVVMPLRAAYQDTRSELAQARELLGRYRAVAEQREALRTSLAELQRTQAESGLFVPGETGALAAAALQDRISVIARRTGGRVRSLQSLPAERSDDGLARVGMEAQIVADIRSLRHLLYELETGRPLLFVNRLETRGRMRQTSEGTTEIDRDLLIRVTVEGYRLGDAS